MEVVEGGGYTITYKERTNSDASYNTWIKDGDYIVVTPGETLNITVGAGGVPNNGGNDGNDSSITGLFGTITAERGRKGNGYQDGGNGGSGGSAITGNSAGSNGNSGTGAQGANRNGIGQGHTTYPFGELGEWASELNLSQFMNVPYSGGGGGDGGMSGGFYGGGSFNENDAIDGYGGGGGGRRYNSGQTGYKGACGCVIIRWNVK